MAGRKLGGVRAEFPVAAASRSMSVDQAAGPATGHAWDGGERRWNAYFAVVLAGTLGLIQVAGPATAQDRLVASAALIAMVPWYLLLGRRAMYGRAASNLPGIVYLCGLVALLAVAEANAGSVTFILLALGPQCFMAVSYRLAIVAVVAMNATGALIALATGAHGAKLEASNWVAALRTAFSIGIRTLIIRIIDPRGEPRRLGTGAEVVLLRVCQEALTNVRRHAGASSARVLLSYCDNEVRLEVADDGAGFDPELPAAGYGLRGMRARVSEIGGELRGRSVPGNGTTVLAEVRGSGFCWPTIIRWSGRACAECCRPSRTSKG